MINHYIIKVTFNISHPCSNLKWRKFWDGDVKNMMKFGTPETPHKAIVHNTGK